MAIKRALLSVYNKEGIAGFGKFLSEQGIGIVSSGGTSKALREAGVQTFDVADLTGFPEMMEGRVKTLHPKIHGGILARREKEEHMEQAQSLGVGMIDLVAVNLYPFEQATSRPDCTVETATENIDIGGPTLIRAAAKNFENVVVISNPARYGEVMGEITANGDVSLETRRKLAVEAFMEISHYDTVIENYLRSKFFPEQKTPEYLNLSFKKIQNLRYGENPSQGNAAFYRDPQLQQCCVATSTQLQGRELSYNNILDINAAFALLKEFEDPTAVIVKHNNPCGVATNGDIIKAYEIATATENVVAIAIGLEDYTADLGTQRTQEGQESLFARSMLVNAARAAGIQAIDSVFSDVADEEGLRRTVQESKALGFEGMGCIHPRQVPVIHAAFAPTEAEIEKALKIVNAFMIAEEKGLGVIALGSKMIDPPVVKRAQKTIAMAIDAGLITANWRDNYGN